MYAIVKTGGKQYRVERGQKLLIERLAAAEGADVKLEPILYRSEEAVFDKAGLERVQVTAKVLAHVRGEKLRVFKFKPKRGYKRRTGHRQDLTQIEVTDISHGKAKAAAGGAAGQASPATAPGERPAKAAADKPAAKRKPGTGKAASTKPAAKAKTAPKAKPAPKPKPAGGQKPSKAKAPAPKAKEESSDGS
ncbi:MAG TPA: 50S ribosomal protein L21 [Solirubrobacteraceae bacterium]|nr:50S ribosomal protein L21 [Solirubrobacteraceae bacterium]